MGKRLTKVLNPFRDFNIENRAHKIISKDKPQPAPKFQSDIDAYNQVLKGNPNIVEELQRKHQKLDENLKHVYLKSFDAPIVKNESSSNRPMPLNRKSEEGPVFGYYEPESVRPGKATLRTVLEFLTQYQENPKINDASKIAKDYTLDEDKVASIIKYCRVFEFYMPSREDKLAKDVKFFGPGVPRFKKPRLTSGDDSDKNT